MSRAGDGVAAVVAEALMERESEGREVVVAAVVEEGRGVEKKGLGRRENDIFDGSVT